MQCRVEGFTRLEHPESDVNEFTHHRPDNQFGRFARSCQAFAKASTPSSFVQGNHRRHVKGFAQEGMTDLGHPRLHLNACARLVVGRCNPRESRSLSGIAETLGVGIEGQQYCDCALTQTRDAIQKSLLVFHAGITIQMIANLFRQCFDLLVQPFDMTDDARLHRIARHIKAIALLSWRGLPPLPPCPWAAQYPVTASQYPPVASMQTGAVVALCFSSHSVNVL